MARRPQSPSAAAVPPQASGSPLQGAAPGLASARRSPLWLAGLFAALKGSRDVTVPGRALTRRAGSKKHGGGGGLHCGTQPPSGAHGSRHPTPCSRSAPARKGLLAKAARPSTASVRRGPTGSPLAPSTEAEDDGQRPGQGQPCPSAQGTPLPLQAKQSTRPRPALSPQDPPSRGFLCWGSAGAWRSRKGQGRRGLPVSESSA